MVNSRSNSQPCLFFDKNIQHFGENDDDDCHLSLGQNYKNNQINVANEYKIRVNAIRVCRVNA